jgi:hypothetical protein
LPDVGLTATIYRKLKFLENLKNIGLDRVWKVFPLPTFRAHAPIQAFYDYYGIAEEHEQQYHLGDGCATHRIGSGMEVPSRSAVVRGS